MRGRINVSRSVAYSLTSAALLLLLQNVPLLFLLSLATAAGRDPDRMPDVSLLHPPRLVAVTVYAAVLVWASVVLRHPQTFRLWYLPGLVGAAIFALTDSIWTLATSPTAPSRPVEALGQLVLYLALTGPFWVAMLAPLIARIIPWGHKAPKVTANQSPTPDSLERR